MGRMPLPGLRPGMNLLLPILSVLMGTTACGPSPELPAPTSPILVQGRPVEEDIRSSEPRVFPLPMVGGQVVDLEVQQQGVDVTVSLVGPDGEVLCRADGPNGNVGPERLVAVVREDGSHRLVVAPWLTKSRGRFEVTVHHQGPARPADLRRAEACRLGWEADRRAGAPERSELERALELYRRVEEKWRALEEPYLAVSAAIEAAGVLLDLNRPREVVARSRETLHQLVELGAPELEPALLNQEGLAHRRLGNLEQAAAAYERVLAVARELGNPREEALALNNLALVVRARGEPWEAMALFEAALDKLRSLGDRASQAIALHNLGDLQLWTERTEAAGELLEQALELERELDQDREQIRTLSSLATVALQKGDLETARRRLEEALTLARRLEDPVAAGVVLDRLGGVREAAGDLEGAAAAFEEALESFARHRAEVAPEDGQGSAPGSSGNPARTRSSLGRVVARLGRHQEARRLHDQAVDTLHRLGEPASEAAARFFRASLARRQGRLADAQQDLEAGLELSEGLRVASGSQELRSQFFASVQDYFQELEDVHMELDRRSPGLGHRRRAVELSEARRSRSLLDLVAGRRRGSGREPELAAERGDLARRLSELRSHLLRARAQQAPEEELELLEREIRTVERQREIARTGVSSLAQTEPLSLKDVQGQLDEETILLVYSLGDERSWVWVVSRTGISPHALAGREVLEELAGRLHGLLQVSHLPGKDEQTRLTAAALAREILAPLEDDLPAGHRLAVLPDGDLHRVPFSVLPTGESGELLLDRHEVVQLPSVSVLAALRERQASRPRAPRAAAAVADAVFTADDPRVSPSAPAPVAQREPTRRSSRASSLLHLDRLPRLPATRREAEAILAPLASRDRWLARDFDANRETFLTAPLEEFRIVHLATHALLDDAFSNEVGVVLSRVTETGEPRNGFLHAFEVAERPLAAELVVLSACHTGLGKMVRGEGLVGLPQSFFDAGATRVLVSLWSIDDQATATLMDHFYRHLRQGQAPGEALRRAQQTLRRQPRWQAPAYWAPFVLHGDWRPFEL